MGENTSKYKRSLLGSGDRLLNWLIEEAFRSYASEIHFDCDEERCRVLFRMDDGLDERYVIEKHNFPEIIGKIKTLANIDISEKKIPRSGHISYSEIQQFNMGVSCQPTIYGEKVILRLLARN